MVVSFDRKLAELDAYLQMLIEESELLDKKIESANNIDERLSLSNIKSKLELLLGSIKHAIVLLQIAKVSIRNSELDIECQAPFSVQSHSNTNNCINSSTESKSSSSISCTNTNHLNSDNSYVTSERQEDFSNEIKPKPQPFKRRAHQERKARNLSLSSSSSCSKKITDDSQQSQLNTSWQSTSLAGSNFADEEKNGHSQENSGSGVAHSNIINNEDKSLASKNVLNSDLNNSAANNFVRRKSSKARIKDGATVADYVTYHGDSDDEEDDAFYDAADEQPNAPKAIETSNAIEKEIGIEAVKCVTEVEFLAGVNNLLDSTNCDSVNIETHDKDNIEAMPKASSNTNSNELNRDNSSQDGSINWDELYEEEEEDLGSLENQGSVIKHLLSQIRIGMDLTKVVLPTFILERRSLLEMYADFFAHPDLFSSITDYETPEERMVQLVKWYLSAFHAGRKSSVAKKPYNPILGEIFLCHWNLNDNSNDSNNQSNRADLQVDRSYSIESNTSCISDIEKFSENLPQDSLMFVAEQVSHHPPVSAFYAENASKLISCCAHIYTKSKYLGLSVGVHNIGQGVIKLLKHNESYVCTFPSAYGRSILTVPWVELGGSVNITCEQTGYSATIEFVTKPFYGGKKHRVMGEILRPSKEPFITIDGEWNGCMYYKKQPNSNEKQIFVDTTKLPVIKKRVRPIKSQETFESRNVWKEVTRALKMHDVTTATASKSFIEQRQRDLLKERMEKGIKWKTRYFEATDDGWNYSRTLEKKLAQQ